MPTRRRFALAFRTLCAVLPLVMAAGAPAQVTVFEEGFEDIGPDTGNGPANLVASGWSFRTALSGPVSAGPWRSGPVNGSDPAPAQGSAQMQSWVSYSSHAVQQHARWIVLPEIPGLSAGQQLEFMLSGYTGEFNDSFEVRLSEGGGTSTGSGVTGVGDFTELLWARSGLGGSPWVLVQIPLPSDGRLALRWVETSLTSPTFMQCYLDDLRVIDDPSFPLPQAGQTVHWTKQHSPVVIDNVIEVPPTGTLIIEPGVSVVCNATLRIDGVVEMRGTAAEQISISGLNSPFLVGGVLARWGHLLMEHVECTALVETMGNAIEGKPSPSLVARNCRFHGSGGIEGNLGSVAIRDCVFEQAQLRARNTLLLVKDVELIDTKLEMRPQHPVTTTVLSGLVSEGGAEPAPVEVRGWNVYFDPDCRISGHAFPVRLDGGGIEPGSVLPTTGNTNNMIEVATPTAWGWIDYPDTGLDYLVRGGSVDNVGGQLTLWPGVRMLLEQNVTFSVDLGARMEIVGRPDNPIVFEPAQPGVIWNSIKFFVNRTRPHVRFAEFRGAERAVHADETVVRVDDCLFEDNIRGGYASTFGRIEIKGSRFFGNDFGVQTSPGRMNFPPGAGRATLTGGGNPNWFEGNGIGLDILNDLIELDAEENYWGHPSGPSHPDNPSGQGDVADFNAVVQPWLTSPPQQTNHTPLVGLLPISGYQGIGSKVILHWSIENDDAITSQRLLWSPHSENPPLTVLIDDIDPRARSVEVTIPDNVPSSNISAGVFRLEATDSIGRVGFEDIQYLVPAPSDWELVNVDVQAPPFVRVGETFPFVGTMQLQGPPTTVSENRFVVIDDRQMHESIGLNPNVTARALSTDTARVVKHWSIGSHIWFQGFSDYFTIRPHDEWGDAPPEVTLLSPAGGAMLRGGIPVEIAWEASDDDFIRSVDIQASYDGGTYWNWVVRGLPGSATSHQWQLPSSTGIDDVRVRVIVRDKRFQATSDTTGAMTILPGEGCYADCNGSVSLDIFDFLCFQDAFATGDPYADCDGNTTLDIFDFLCFQDAFVGGCP